jgi:ABC-2 type transport system permease protein
MSAIVVGGVGTPRATFNPVPLARITAAELRKMFGTRSGFWLIASLAISAVLAIDGVILFATATSSPTPLSRPQSASPW